MSTVAEFTRLIEETEAHSREEKAAQAELNPAKVQQCKSALFSKAEGSES